MDFQNYFYTFVQIIHNLGAVAVVISSILSQIIPFCNSHQLLRRLAFLLLIGWIIQGLSGAGFGAVSYYYHKKFPDIHGIALAALFIKMAATTTGILAAVFYLKKESYWSETNKNLFWKLMIVLAISALSAAALLRWFS